MDGKKKKIVNLMRLAYKAGKVSLGRTAVERSIRQGEAKIIFIGTRDNSFIQKEEKIWKEKGIQIVSFFNEKELAEIFSRPKLVIVSINNLHFAEGIRRFGGEASPCFYI
ncbi:MAG: ribosomal L7Ae/L30e/S12e/Gadd45 family protein [Candidatus Cloacimonadia bacterium]